MKRASFFVFVSLLCSAAFANPVTQEQALLQAKQFMASRSQGVVSGSARLAKRQPQLQTDVSPASSDDRAAYYVFNIDADGGFVIVSGDDRTPAILGYSDKGQFDDNAIPENMRVFLKSYEEQMQWLDSQPQDPNPQPSQQRRVPSLKRSVSPLLTTTWNQDNPYNKNIPSLQDAEFVTGCVATAMAQIMNYHGQQTGQPECVMADIPGYNSTFKYNGTIRTITFGGFPKGTPLDWEHMQDSYEQNAYAYTDEQRAQQDAVANLMYYCGVSVSMKYNQKASSASTSSVPIALKDYFGYDSATRIIRRESYCNEEWEDIICSELLEQRPVLYSGTSGKIDNSGGTGHAFVVDGFDGEGMFHINWGWGGDCDGYFLLSVAKPADKFGIGAGSSDDGYTRDQTAVIGAQPDTGAPVVEEPLQLGIAAVKASGNALSFEARNYNTKSGVFEYGIGLLADNGHITEISHYQTNFPASSGTTYSYANATFTVNASNLNANTCKIAAISRESGATQWQTPMNPNSYYIKAVKSGNSVTLTVVPTPELELEEITLNRNTSGKSRQQIEARIKNNGDEFFGEITMTVRSESTGTSSTIAQGTFVPAGQTETASFSFSPQQKGNHIVTISYNDPNRGQKVLGTETIYAPAMVLNNVPLTITMEVTNSVQINGVNYILGKKAHLVTTVRNDSDDDYEGLIWPVLFTNSTSYRTDIKEYIAAHDEAVYERDYDVEVGLYSYYSTLCLVQKGNSITPQYGPAYQVKPAVIIYTADGHYNAQEATTSVTVPADAVAVDLSGNNTTVSVTPSSNPNCLYYLDASAVTPLGLTANVVKGTRAESLTLSDQGLSFLPLSDFTADTVTYTRLFDKGVTVADGHNGPEVHPSWTTICLPFDVTECVVAGEKVEWMSPEGDTPYNFWLMEYLGDERNTLFFAPSETMQAYTPYLVAVPGAKLKGLRDMTASPVTFCGANASIKADTRGSSASSNYKFVGTMQSVTDTNKAYNIDEDGTGCHRGTVNARPFSAYVKALEKSVNTSYVPINIDATIDVEAVEMEEGDVNGDGTVDVADISAVIGVMAGNASEEYWATADVNGDGVVDVADISAIIQIMAR